MKTPFFRPLVCAVLGHMLEGEHSYPTVDRGNWTHQCSYCGRFVVHGRYAGKVTMSKREFKRFMNDFYEACPWAKDKDGGSDDD